MGFLFPDPYPCALCELVSDRLPAAVVYESDLVYVLMNISNRSRAGVHIAPKRHVRSFQEVNDVELEDLIWTVHLLTIAMIDVLEPNGLHTWCSAGIPAGQSEAHMHIQIQPRFLGVPYDFASSEVLSPISLDKREAFAHKLRMSINKNGKATYNLGNFEYPSESIIVPYNSALDRYREDGTLVVESLSHYAVIPEYSRRKGALTILPKKMESNILYLSPEELVDLIWIVRKMSRLIGRTFDPDGLNTWWENGVAAGQGYSHYMIEMVPRFEKETYKYVDRKALKKCDLHKRVEVATLLGKCL